MKPEGITFNKETYTLLLSVDKSDIAIPSYVDGRAQELGFKEKEEFHITIFGFSVGKKIEEALRKNPHKIADFIELVENTHWSYETKDEYYSVEKMYDIKGVKEERKSIIMMVKVEGIEELIKEVNHLLGTDISYPPTHITLFTTSTNRENAQAGIGITSEKDLSNLNPSLIFPPYIEEGKYKAIALPTRPQPDTIVAIFILKNLGREKLTGIEKAEYIFTPRLKEGETEEHLIKKGVLPVDIGGGLFDHHNKAIQITASALVADYLGLKNNPALSKLLQYAERDDFFGKGTISSDPLDRAFGLSGLIGSLNKKYVDNPEVVIEIVLPILAAFYEEENRRAFEMPKELEEKIKNGKAQVFYTKQRNKNLKCIFIETDNASMAGYLRSKGGGGYDVVALKRSTGHVNILTRPLQKVDLRSLVVLIRMQEAEAGGTTLDGDPSSLSTPGVIKQVENWYYDPATNSLLNGGPNPQDIEPTKIDSFEFQKLLEIGLSERLWVPR